VIVFSDLTSKEISVMINDIQEASAVTSGKVSLGNYELFDLVQINPHTVGVIIKVERDSFRILDNNGTVQTIRLQEIGHKRNSKDTVAFDNRQNPLSQGDIVKVLDGQYKGRQGTIKHIFKYFAFLHSKDMMEHSGIFVVRTSNCFLFGGMKNRNDLSAPSPRPSPMISSSANRGRGPRGQVRLPNRRVRNDDLIGKTIVIKTGQWKGYIGVVKAATESTVRIELHTNTKIITVPRENV